MSDPNNYINAYIDHAMGMIHEQINTILQLKTNLKVTTDLVKQKDEVIATFDNQLKNSDNSNNELNISKEKNTKLEQECNALRNKISHFDSLLNQFNGLKDELTKKIQECGTLKEEISKKDSHIDELRLEIEELKKPQVDIINSKVTKNTKKTKLETVKLEDNDDF